MAHPVRMRKQRNAEENPSPLHAHGHCVGCLHTPIICVRARLSNRVDNGVGWVCAGTGEGTLTHVQEDGCPPSGGFEGFDMLRTWVGMGRKNNAENKKTGVPNPLL